MYRGKNEQNQQENHQLIIFILSASNSNDVGGVKQNSVYQVHCVIIKVKNTHLSPLNDI